MKDIVYNLYYNISPTSNAPNEIGVFLLLFAFIIIIIALSLNITKTYLSRNWENKRCDNIVLAGYLQPDTSIKPHDYTLENLKYCIKQSIYNDTPLLAYLNNLYDKLKYLLEYIKKQIGLYDSYIKTEVETKSQKYKDVNMNKINYLKQKQSKLKYIYDKLDTLFKDTSNKIKIGVNNKNTLLDEKQLNEQYKSDRYYNFISSNN